MAVRRVRGWVAWVLSVWFAAGCGDDASSSPSPSTCSDAGCAGDAAGGQGGAGARAESGSGGARAPVADGGRESAAGGGSGGAGAAGRGGHGTSAGASGAAGPEAAGSGAAGEAGSPGAGAGGSSGSAPEPECTACETYAAPVELTRVKAAELNAMSGLAIGRKNPGIIFAHNDRNRAVVYALDMQGELRGRFSLTAAQPTDVEDIAIGPCPSGSCVYLADIGDNAAARREYAILRFPEPELPASSSVEMSSPMFERLPFTYEDGSHNAEGFMVDPGSGKLYVVTKVADGQPSRVYRIDEPAMSNGARRAVKVADLSVPKASDMAISAAAAQPCGRGFALRAYNVIYEFRIAAGAGFEQAFTAQPIAITAPDEQQSEAIDYLPDGRGLISSGEGMQVPIFATRCGD